MEGSESEAVFNSLNLRPQSFISEVLIRVDDLVDEYFDSFHQQASRMLKVEGTERSEDLRTGVHYSRSKSFSVLDAWLSVWENYCLRNVFAVPEGFSLPKNNQTAGDFASDEELGRQLNSLRNKLVEKEITELNKESHELERLSVPSNHCFGPINEVLQLDEERSKLDVFQGRAEEKLEGLQAVIAALLKNQAAGDFAMVVDTTSDEELDRQLNSLRRNLASIITILLWINSVHYSKVVLTFEFEFITRSKRKQLN